MQAVLSLLLAGGVLITYFKVRQFGNAAASYPPPPLVQLPPRPPAGPGRLPPPSPPVSLLHHEFKTPREFLIPFIVITNAPTRRSILSPTLAQRPSLTGVCRPMPRLPALRALGHVSRRSSSCAYFSAPRRA